MKRLLALALCAGMAVLLFCACTVYGAQPDALDGSSPRVQSGSEEQTPAAQEEDALLVVKIVVTVLLGLVLVLACTAVWVVRLCGKLKKQEEETSAGTA